MDSSISEFVHIQLANWGFSSRMTNSVDPGETAHDEPFHLDLHCLQRYLFWSAGMKGLKERICSPWEPILSCNSSTSLFL